MKSALVFLVLALTAALAIVTTRPPVVSFGSTANLDCTKSFDANVALIAARPAVVADIYQDGADAYRDDRSLALFVVTKPGHPAHPAIFTRSIVLSTEGSGVVTGGCGYGDHAALQHELSLYSDFDRLLNAEEKCWLCSNQRLVSPTVDHRYPPPSLPSLPST